MIKLFNSQFPNYLSFWTTDCNLVLQLFFDKKSRIKTFQIQGIIIRARLVDCNRHYNVINISMA